MMQAGDFPRVMVFSNQSFSKSNSNGRTLGLLFEGWPKDRLCQFCVSLTDPDYNICTNYFCVSDGDALAAAKSLGLRRKSQSRAGDCSDKSAPASTSTTRSRTALISILRDIVWNSRLWQTHEYKKWRNGFKPDIVVVQSGDSGFMLNLARHTAKHFAVPLIIFNTEGYLFFDHNFLHRGHFDSISFPLFKHLYRRAFMKAFRMSAGSVYLNARLDNDYQKLLKHRSVVIYNSSNLKFRPAFDIATPPRFSYLGNLGIRRPEALAEFAAVLQRIDERLAIDVYGKMPRQGGEILNNTPGLNYHGAVSYQRVQDIIAESDFLVHVEKNDPVLVNELRYAFSTKIADCICSGRNFIVYAPDNLACSQYIAETGAAWHASSTQELESTLRTAISDYDARQAVLERARISAANHNATANQQRFREFIVQLVK